MGLPDVLKNNEKMLKVVLAVKGIQPEKVESAGMVEVR